MSDYNKTLKQLGLHLDYNNDADREPIDFTIRDGRNDIVASVWGSNPWNDIDWESEHDDMYVEYGDDDEQGEDIISGDMCDWHWVNDGDGIVRWRETHDWHKSKEPGGLIKEIIDDIKERF